MKMNYLSNVIYNYDKHRMSNGTQNRNKKNSNLEEYRTIRQLIEYEKKSRIENKEENDTTMTAFDKLTYVRKKKNFHKLRKEKYLINIYSTGDLLRTDVDPHKKLN